MFKCLLCGKTFKNNAGLVVHSNFCDGSGTKLDKKMRKIPFFCPLCGCLIKASHKSHVRVCDGVGPYRRKRESTGLGRYWSKGKTYEEIYGLERKDAIIKKHREAALLRKPFSQETRKKLSDIAKNNGFGGYKPGIGRGRRGRYKGIWCDSSWELAYVIFNLDHGIKFERNKKAFVYQYKGRDSRFYPDFVLPDETYVEIKGYWSEQFSIKIEQFPGKLLILSRKEVLPYLDYVKQKYGKDFTRLYDDRSKPRCANDKYCIECNKQISSYSRTGRCLACAVIHRKYKLRGSAKEKKCCKLCSKSFYPATKNSLYCSHACAHKASRRFEVSTDELCDLIWSMPIVEVAKIMRVSTVAIIKRCNSLGIERPPQGYWLRKKHI